MLRPFEKSDLIAMLGIEAAAQVVPWTEETFKMCFQQGYQGWVLENERHLIGFVIVSINNIECHILNLCVSPEHQHQGWGAKLMEYAVIFAKQQGAGIVYLEVRRTNSRAISLYKKLDFHLVGERKGYYPVQFGQEDALIYAKSLVKEL